MTAPQSSSALDAAFLSVWRQTLVDRAKEVSLESKTYLVRRTAKRRLAQVDFELGGVSYRALEQNPQTKSRWAAMARGGAKAMQFLTGGRYIAVVADAKLTRYTRSKRDTLRFMPMNSGPRKMRFASPAPRAAYLLGD